MGCWSNVHNQYIVIFYYHRLLLYVYIFQLELGHVERKESERVFGGLLFCKNQGCLPRTNKAHSRPSKGKPFSFSSLTQESRQITMVIVWLVGRLVITHHPRYLSNQRNIEFTMIPKLSMLKLTLTQRSKGKEKKRKDGTKREK